MTVTDLVALGRYPHTNWFGRTGPRDQKIIRDAIEKAGLSGLRTGMLSSLSDGERQRAMNARVLAQDTGILVMDEPTAFLDVNSKYEINSSSQGTDQDQEQNHHSFQHTIFRLH
jgi:iron complex transport system ATP-binding protein